GHLVHQYPVREQLRPAHLAPDLHPNGGVGIGEALTPVHTLTGFGHHPHGEPGGWKASVIAADDTRRTAYPFPYRIAAVAEGARLELDVYGRAVDPDVVGGRSRGCRRRGERPVSDRGRGGDGAGGPGARPQRSVHARCGPTARARP